MYVKHGYIVIRKCRYFGATLNLNKVVDASCKDVGQVFVGGNSAKGDFIELNQWCLVVHAAGVHVLLEMRALHGVTCM